MTSAIYPRLLINYDEPPVIDINNGERYVNGKWVDGRAEFPDAVAIPTLTCSVRMWIWLTSGTAYPIDIEMVVRNVMPHDTITITNILLTD